MRNSVREMVPVSWRARRARALRLRYATRELVPVFLNDLSRYIRHSSSTGPFRSRDNLRSKITATYHNIEKGLSLPAPRPGFGERVVGDLVTLVLAYIDTYGYDDWVGTPIAVLRSYRDFNDSASCSIPSEKSIDSLVRGATENLGDVIYKAGIRTVDRSDTLHAVDGVGLDFFTSRSSVRQFSSDPVDDGDIEFAALAAQRAPAVCNRQFGRLYIYRNKLEMEPLLRLQGGARGFGEQLGGLAVITTDLRNFWAPGERHQAWTDGGLFAMSFILGLHSRGLGTICLNWSKKPSVDRELRQLVDLPEEAIIIMLVGFGKLLPSYNVANSERVPLSETLQIRSGSRKS